MVQGGDFTNFDGSGGYAHPSNNSARREHSTTKKFLSHSSEGIFLAWPISRKEYERESGGDGGRKTCEIAEGCDCGLW